jgi:pyruvate-formate lyase-activating enzyme
MANVGLPPKDWSSTESGEFLTYILPASGGCNLKCSFCLIAQRQETTGNSLPASGFADYTRGVARKYHVVGLAIQGHEPLLPSSLEYAEAILSTAAELGIPASLVTNGTHLPAALPLLRETRLRALGVSLDAASSERHDRLRGVEGAWAATVRAIPQAVEQGRETGMQVSILSVLLPNRRSYLDGVPKVARELGTSRWIVSPLLALERDAWSGLAAKRRLLDDLLVLTDAAKREGVALIVDDELDLIGPGLDAVDRSAAAALNIRKLPDRVTLSRLSPGGECSIGAEILQPLSSTAPRWRGEGDAAAFYHGAKEAFLGRAPQPVHAQAG